MDDSSSHNGMYNGTRSGSSGGGLGLSASFDRSLIWHRGRSVRYLVAEVIAPSAAGNHADAMPLNLALVIDASGSMAGPPLEAAKTAVLRVIDGLDANDRLTVVSFADDVVTHVRSRPMDAAGRAEANAAILPLGTRGSTDLCAGWLAGAEHVARDMEARRGCRNHVVLLSDGHANRGEVDPGQLAIIAGELRDRGLLTSTVGIGDGYSPIQLQAIAEAGGGRMHDAERPEEIAEVVVAELQQVSATVVENVEVFLELPSTDVDVSVVGSAPMATQGGIARVSLGSLIGEARRRVVLKVTTPSANGRTGLFFRVRATWRAAGSEAQLATSPQDVSLTFAGGSENSAQGRDVALSLEVAQAWLSAVVRKIVAFNREGGFAAGGKYATAELKYFERYCHGLPGGEALVEQMRQTAASISRPWTERGRKEVELAMYKMQRSESDVRHLSRPAWGAFVPKNK